jgi:hypothetical protein
MDSNWVQYQICLDIEMSHNSNFVVWTTIKIAFGILGSIPIHIDVWMYKGEIEIWPCVGETL